MTTTTVIHDFNYVVIGCNYVRRLIKHVDSIRKSAAEILENCLCDNTEEPSTDQREVRVAKRPSTCPNCLKNNLVGLYDKSMYIYGDKKDSDCLNALLTGNQLYGSVCFRCECLQDAFELVNILREFNHCACFGEIPYKMELVESHYNDIPTKILVMRFDTESG